MRSSETPAASQTPKGVAGAGLVDLKGTPRRPAESRPAQSDSKPKGLLDVIGGSAPAKPPAPKPPAKPLKPGDVIKFD